MVDREKVIKGLELCEIGSGDRCYEADCPYYGRECTESLKNDILALLKEQEQMRVLSQRESETLPNHFERKGFCPKCHQVVEWYLNRYFCGFCGQEMRWDE